MKVQLAGLLLYGLLGGIAIAQSNSEPVASVVTQAATVRLFQGKATGFGRVQSSPAKVLTIAAPHDGTLLKVFVRSGEAVQQDEALAELSAAPATQEAYRKAQTALQFAKDKLERVQYLWSKGATTKDLLDQAQVAYRDAEAALQAQTRMGAEQSHLTLKAPVAGTVTAVQVAEGDQVTQNTKILAMTPTDALAVLLGVEPEDVRNLRLGMAVSFTPAFEPQKHFEGKVTAINNVVDPQTRLVDVLADVVNAAADAPLIGTEMRGEIALDAVRALAVPREALIYNGQTTFVFLERNGRAARVSVEPGAEGGGYVAVTGSLKEGDAVVIQGNYELKDGMRIEQASRGVQ